MILSIEKGIKTIKILFWQNLSEEEVLMPSHVSYNKIQQLFGFSNIIKSKRTLSFFPAAYLLWNTAGFFIEIRI